jgi:hypothetical protein
LEFVSDCAANGLPLQQANPESVPQFRRLALRLGEDGISEAVNRYQAGESALRVAESLGVSKSSLIDLLRDAVCRFDAHTA